MSEPSPHPTTAELQQRQVKCDTNVRLWDSVAVVGATLYQQPGRRVLLVVSDGNDAGSFFRWNQLSTFTAGRGVTVFAVSDPGNSWRIHVAREHRRILSSEIDRLSKLCQLTGGLNLESSPAGLIQSLSNILTLVRDRYIVEFPRPMGSQLTSSTLDVRIKGGHTLVHASGISFPPATAPETNKDAVTKAQPRPVPGSRVVSAPH